jgi:hypothetical protein
MNLFVIKITMFYDIKSIFNYWKSYINKLIIDILKCINCLKNLLDLFIYNKISYKIYCKKYNVLLNNHNLLKKEYLNNRYVSKKKFNLINEYNTLLLDIENNYNKLFYKNNS